MGVVEAGHCACSFCCQKSLKEKDLAGCSVTAVLRPERREGCLVSHLPMDVGNWEAEPRPTERAHFLLQEV